MSLEKILERIQQDAQTEIDKIKSNADAVVDGIMKKAYADAEALKSKLLDEAKNEAEQHKQRIISIEKLDLRKALLDEKQKAIDSAFQKALKGLLKMDINRYRKLLMNMVISNVTTGDEEIILSKNDKSRLGENFIKDVNRLLVKNGKKGNLALSKDSYDILGGFVMRRGQIELNSSFESLFKSSRDELELKVSKMLFSDISKH